MTPIEAIARALCTADALDPDALVRTWAASFQTSVRTDPLQCTPTAPLWHTYCRHAHAALAALEALSQAAPAG